MAIQNTAIQKFSNDDQRLALLEQFNPSEHLLTWEAYDKAKSKKVMVQYYPASWRLYELRLRYPTAKFDIDIILMDQERNFCVVRAKLFVGPDYETAEVRSIAHKQGFLTELDRVETKAKARAARDLGISTELALDMDDVPEGDPQQKITVADEHVQAPRAIKPTIPDEVKARLNNLFERAMALRLLKASNAKSFLMWASEVIGKPITESAMLLDTDMNALEEHIATLEHVPAIEKPKLAIVPTEQPTTNDHVNAPDPQEQSITTKQIESIRKLSQYLSKPVPDQITALTNVEARQIIQQLTSEYRQVRQAVKA